MKERLEKAIETNPMLKQFKKQILIDITTEGLRIQIVDEKNRPMFDLGGAHMKSLHRTDIAGNRQDAE